MAEITKPNDLDIVWAELGEKREPSNSKKRQGWVVEIPTFQDFNWLDGRQDQAIGHINQHGIPMWDEYTEYQGNRSYVMGGDGNIYEALTTHTGANPLSSPGDWRIAFWGARNTTVDTNGFIKEASPIVKVFENKVETNEFASDVVFEKQTRGVYKLYTERPLAGTGWTIETPKDINGNVLVFVEYEEVDDGILIKSYKPSYKNGRVVAGTSTDVPQGRWIDVRLSYIDSDFIEG